MQYFNKLRKHVQPEFGDVRVFLIWFQETQKKYVRWESLPKIWFLGSGIPMAQKSMSPLFSTRE